MIDLIPNLVEVIEFEADADDENTVLGGFQVDNANVTRDLDVVGAEKGWETDGTAGSYIRMNNPIENPLTYTAPYMINIIVDVPANNPGPVCQFLANIFGTIVNSQKFFIGLRLNKWEVAIRDSSPVVSPNDAVVGTLMATLLYDGGADADSGSFWVNGTKIMDIQPGTDPCTDNAQRLTFGARSANPGVGMIQARYGEAQFYQGGGDITQFDGTHVAELWNNGAYKTYDSDTNTLRTLINVNPQLDNPIPDQETLELDQFEYTFPEDTFSDENGDPITYTATLADDSPLPTWISFDGPTRTFTGVPLKADVGTTSVKVIADDGKGGTNSTTFDIIITALQRPFEDLANTVRCRFADLVETPLGIPTQYDNQPFEKPEDSRWIRLSVRPGRTNQVDTGAQTRRYRINGVAVASIRSPLSQGDLGILEIADSIAAVFRGVSVGNVTFRTPTVVNLGRRQKEWVYDVECPFFADNLI